MTIPPQQPGNTAAPLNHPRSREPIGNELNWESTVTAPTEFVPYTYTDAEVARITGRRRVSIAAVICGLAALALGIIGVFGLPLALTAIILALIARTTENRARTLWLSALICGIVGVILCIGWVAYIVVTVLPLV